MQCLEMPIGWEIIDIGEDKNPVMFMLQNVRR